jgi:putative membrane protein
MKCIVQILVIVALISIKQLTAFPIAKSLIGLMAKAKSPIVSTYSYDCLARQNLLRTVNVDYLIGEKDHKHSEYDEDSFSYAPDEITYRVKFNRNIPQAIPQAERYSTKDWFHNLKTLPNSRLLRRIKKVVLTNTIWSAAVFLVHKFIFPINIGVKCFSLLGSSLSLLLVFRTNTAYNRFWEGRKIWERIVTNLRNIGRMTMIYSALITKQQLEKIFNLSCAFPIVLQEHLCASDSKFDLLKSFMTEDEILTMCKVSNRPYYILCKLTKEVAGLRDRPSVPDEDAFTSRERQLFFRYIDDLSSCIGAAERLIQTPVPLTYARHTSRFLTLFCFSAPLSLVVDLGIYTIPFVGLMTWSLFGILEIGMTIEEPFQRALKLELFADAVIRDFSDLIHVTDISGSKSPLVTSPAFEYEEPLFNKLYTVHNPQPPNIFQPVV